MFLKRIRATLRQTEVKMTLWHLLFLMISLFFLFIIFYLLYSKSLLDKDHQILKAKYNEYKVIFNQGGIKALDDFITSQDNAANEDSEFFVRIESSDHNTIFFRAEGKRPIFNIKEIEHGLYEVNEKKQWFYIKTKRNEDDLEVLSIKIKDNEYLQIGKTVDDRDELLDRFEKIFAEVLIVALLLGGIGGYILSHRTLKPIRDLIRTLNSIIKGDEEARVPLSENNDELEELTRLFNQMLDRIKNSNQGMRQTLDTIAHELRTPLTSIRAQAEVNLKRDNITQNEARYSFENCIEGIDEILAEFKMMTDITEVESGLQNLKKEKVEIKSICQDIIDLYEIIAEQKNISISLELPATNEFLQIYIDRKKIRQALANLLDNALKYSPNDSQVTVSYFRHGQFIFIQVKDQGIGINKDELPHIWKRLYRGENSRSEKGIGLGLSLVKSIVEAHDGSITVETNEGSGSFFTIKLPIS